MNLADAHLDPLRRIGQVVADRYRITSLIGEGGMGSVYLAEHVQLHERVVLKFLHGLLASDPALRERFRREAKALIRLRHPGIVTIHDFGEHEHEPYIALEYLDGLTLAELINKEPPLSLAAIFQIFDQLMDILAATHAAGVIHRDLKPENVMLLARSGEPPRVKVLDFGIARISEDDGSADTKLTSTGAIFGTPSYMSPEQCKGLRVVPESDVYSAATMLFLALTRTLPFASDSHAEILAQQLFVPAPTLAQRGAARDLPPGLETLVARGLAKNPAERPSASEFRKALQSIAAGQNTESRDATDMLRRKAMAGLSREERAWAVLGDVSTAGGPPDETPVTQVNEAPMVLLWGFDPARSAALRAAFAVNGIDSTIVLSTNAPNHLGAVASRMTERRWDALVISGDDWAARMATLPPLSKRPPVFVVDVFAAREISALVRAGASDVALSTIPVDALASKLRRLIQRSR